MATDPDSHKELIQQALHKQSKCAWQFVAGILNKFGHTGGDIANPLWNDQAKL